MAQLIVSFNNQIIQRVKLTKPTYLIGRNRDCDIVLPERTISGQHAKLVNTGEDCFLEDTNSTNGIFINHQSVSQHLLIDDDVIHIGKYELLFHHPVDLDTQLRQLSIHPRLMGKPQTAWLEITDGRKQGNIIPLVRDKITLGGQGIETVVLARDPGNKFSLQTQVGASGADSAVGLQEGDNFSVGDVELVFHTA